MPSRDLELERIVTALSSHEVNYTLVGGLAVFIHGGESPTMDLDLAFERSTENIKRLGTALRSLGSKPKRWLTEEYQLSKADLASGRLHLESDAGDIDLIASTPGTTYESLAANAKSFEVGRVTIRVASIPSLIAIKEKAGRPRDLRHVEELKAILETQEPLS